MKTGNQPPPTHADQVSPNSSACTCPERACHRGQSSVEGPEWHAGQQGRCQQLCIDPADSRSAETVRLHQGHYLVLPGLPHLRESGQECEDLAPALQTATGEFSDHEWVAPGFPAIEVQDKVGITPSHVVNPDRGVHEHQDGFVGLRRGVRPSPFSVPPRAASLLELSQAISASRPARTTAVFSLMPLRRWASCNRSSSIFRVVLMSMSMASSCI